MDTLRGEDAELGVLAPPDGEGEEEDDDDGAPSTSSARRALGAAGLPRVVANLAKNEAAIRRRRAAEGGSRVSRQPESFGGAHSSSTSVMDRTLNTDAGLSTKSPDLLSQYTKVPHSIARGDFNLSDHFGEYVSA